MNELPSEPLDGHLFGEGQPCFGCGPNHPIGFKLRFERDGDEVLTRFTPADIYQGPPGIMHGGLVSTLADELAAWTVLAQRGLFGFTTAFSCKLVRPVRIGRELIGRGKIVRDRRRLMDIEVEISQEGERCFESQFSFVVLDARGTERMLQRPLPDDWKRFTRGND